MKNSKKILAILVMALMVVTLSTCVSMASEGYDQGTVKEVQQALNDAGFSCGTPDGIAGNNTRKAISDFQEAKGLEVTGEINDELLEALFPTKPEETEAAVDTTTDAEETQNTEPEKPTAVDKPTPETKTESTEKVSEGDICYEMTEDDAMFFTFEDGVLYRMTFSGDFVVYDKMVDFETVEKKVRSHIHKDLVNYVVGKYFCAAIAKDEGLPMREEEEVDINDFFTKSQEDDPKFLKWETYNCRLSFVRDDTTWVMYYEDDLIKVGKLEGEEVVEVLSFEGAKEETETFVNRTFINSRLADDEDIDFVFVVHSDW